MAEYWSRHQLQQAGFDGMTIQSAGLGALRNRPIAPEMQLILNRHDINSDAHRGQQVSETLAVDADIIFVMEPWQKKELALAFPNAHGKIFLLGQWRDEVISDPYRETQDVFEKTFKLIKSNWKLWQHKLWQN